MPYLLTEREAAEYLGLAPITLRKGRTSGSFPRYAKMGKSVRYRPEDLEAWVQSRLVNSTSEKVGA